MDKLIRDLKHDNRWLEADLKEAKKKLEDADKRLVSAREGENESEVRFN